MNLKAVRMLENVLKVIEGVQTNFLMAFTTLSYVRVIDTGDESNECSTARECGGRALQKQACKAYLLSGCTQHYC